MGKPGLRRGVTGTLAEVVAGYIAAAVDTPLPPDVIEKTKHHILDTMAAIVSGTHLRAGVLAVQYAKSMAGTTEATLIGAGIRVPAVHAALANGMSAHADETDDSHLAGRFHPGCGIVPAALAVAERQGRSGMALIRAVALGYDIGARVNMALGLNDAAQSRFSTHSLGTLFGAAAASAALLHLNTRQVQHVLSFAVQQASGVPYWNRDSEHVEKAFDFGGMGARDGVAAATMVASGFTGVEDPFSGAHNLFTAFGDNTDADADLLLQGLGERFEITRASIKKWCVGSPIQAPMDAITTIVTEYGLRAADVRRITIHMPDDRLHIVSDREMPAVCLQHLIAVAVIDGTLTFASAHDLDRMSDPEVLAVRHAIEVIPSPALTVARPARQSIVEVDTHAGQSYRHRAKVVRGTPENPMTTAEVERKAFDLMTDIVGSKAARQLVDILLQLDALTDLGTLSQALLAVE